jgi:signal transduction histidine kinase
MIERELYETEKIFKELFDHMGRGVGVYETKDEGKSFIIREMNKAGLRICQATRNEIIGKNVAELFPNVEEFGFVDSLRRVWKTSKPEHSPTAFYQDERLDGWTELYIYKLSSGKLVTIFERQSELIEVEEKYEKKVEFEKSVSTISSRFVNPINIDDAINSTLKEIGILTKASRSYLFLFNEDKKTMSNTHEWTVEGVDPQLQEQELQNVPMEIFAWSINKLKKGEILNIDNIADLPLEATAEREEFQRENIKSLIMMPLKIGDEYHGFVGLDNTRAPETWKEGDLNLLKITIEIIGNAIKRKNTEKELHELTKELQHRVSDKTTELSALNKIITLGNEATNPQEFLEKSYDQVLDIVNFDRGGVYLYNHETNHNILVYHKNVHPDFIAAVEDVDISEGLFSKVFDKRKPYFIEDFSLFMENSKELGVHSAVIVPLRSKDEYVGSLNIGSSVHQNLSQNELELLVAVGKQMGIIIQKFESEKLLKESEEKYRKSYNHANLYRDIFAHDINNILQNIQSSAELSSLYLNNPEKLGTLKELYDIITEQIERGRKLIENVRKITEIDQSKVVLEKVEAYKTLKKAIEYLKNSFQARTINIVINSSEKMFYVNANNLLLDIFENILINAVRHNNKSKIEIIIDIGKYQADRINYFKMEFKDNGIGISDYRKKSIFEKGTRKSQKSKGMGLGLSLVKKIIDTYNGVIWVEDRVKGDYKQGSNFVILLQEAD